MALNDWILPNVTAPLRASGESNLGKVLVNGKPLPPDVAREWADRIRELADIADAQPTQVEASGRYSAVDVAADLAHVGIMLARPERAAWESTYNITALTLIEDILEDEQPAQVTLVLLPTQATDTVMTVDGMCIRTDRSTEPALVFEDGYVAPLDSVHAIVVHG